MNYKRRGLNYLRKQQKKLKEGNERAFLKRVRRMSLKEKCGVVFKIISGRV